MQENNDSGSSEGHIIMLNINNNKKQSNSEQISRQSKQSEQINVN